MMPSLPIASNPRTRTPFLALLQEFIWPCDFEMFQDAEAAIPYAFEDYNQNRVHSAIGYATPSEFGTARRAMIK